MSETHRFGNCQICGKWHVGECPPVINEDTTKAISEAISEISDTSEYGRLKKQRAAIEAKQAGAQDTRIAELEAERDRLLAACAEKEAALGGVISDMDELFASTDHLEMALHLARAGNPLITSEGGPENFRRARQALSSDGSGYAAVVAAALRLMSEDENPSNVDALVDALNMVYGDDWPAPEPICALDKGD